MMGEKILASNRRARFDYEILETVEAGLVLTGTEIKAVREGRANITEAFAAPEGGEMWLFNSHIAPYSAASVRDNHRPTRPRKLLLHKGEAADLSMQVGAKGFTIVPLRLYLRRRVAKVELGVARGRRRYDKRRVLIEREREKEARDALGRHPMTRQA